MVGQNGTMEESLGIRPKVIIENYREVLRWEIFMEQELNFGLDLGRLALKFRHSEKAIKI